jgi:RNA polymerase sigma-70 factor (ECF subfamily)
MRNFAEDESVQTGSGSSGSPDDYALMEAVVARRDADALGELYDRHSRLVMALCLRMLQDRAEAEDVLIEVFHELWDRCQQYDPGRSAPRTYLVLLARSRSIDRLRSKSGQALRASDSSDLELMSSAANPLEHVESLESRARVVSAVRQLEPAQRQAIECSFYEGLSHARVAEKLGKPLGTVKTSIRTGLIKLREMLAESQ